MVRFHAASKSKVWKQKISILLRVITTTEIGNTFILKYVLRARFYRLQATETLFNQ